MRATRRQVLAGSSAALATAALGLPRIANAQEEVTVRWTHVNTAEVEQAAWQAIADQFEEANPNVKIDITVLENEAFKQQLTTQMQSGDPPDIFQTWGGGVLFQYADAGLVKDIAADLAVDGWGDSFLPAALELHGQNGQYYGVPWRSGMVAFWYNKALFSQAGIEAPPATWTEFLDTVSALKEAGITPLTVGEGDKWPGHFYWVYLAIRSGGKAAFDAAYSREGSFADPPFVRAGELLQELINLEPFQDGFLGQVHLDATSLFANGQVAMMLMGHWLPSDVLDLSESGEGLGDDLGVFAFPAVDGGAGGPTDVLGGGDGYAIGINAPQEAIDFVRFLTSVENQTALAEQGIAVPPAVVEAAAGLQDPNLIEVANMAAEAEYLQLYYDQFLPPAVGATVNDAVQTLFAGSATPEDVAQQIEDSAAQEIAG